MGMVSGQRLFVDVRDSVGRADFAAMLVISGRSSASFSYLVSRLRKFSSVGNNTGQPSVLPTASISVRSSHALRKDALT